MYQKNEAEIEPEIIILSYMKNYFNNEKPYYYIWSMEREKEKENPNKSEKEIKDEIKEEIKNNINILKKENMKYYQIDNSKNMELEKIFKRIKLKINFNSEQKF